MTRIRSRSDMLKESSAHRGERHFKIFYRNEKNERVLVDEFWAKDDAEAQLTLDIYKKKMQLVGPNDDREYFYGKYSDFTVSLDNGKIAEFDSFDEWRKFTNENRRKRESIFSRILDRVRDIFGVITGVYDTVRWFISDLVFWIRHYEKDGRKSHNVSEAWSIDIHLLDDLEFNIPKLISDKHGFPTEYCVKARALMHSEDDGFDVNASFRLNPNSTDEELDFAAKLWNEELENLLLHIRLYRYYECSGIIDGYPAEYAELDAEYRKTLPYIPGTDRELDYGKLSDMTDAEWDTVWAIWARIGRGCWD